METKTSTQPTPEYIMQLAWGYTAPLIVAAALEHRVFDLLDAGPRTVSELAAETGASVRGLRAILNALVGLQLLTREGERYALNEQSAAFLVSTKPAYFGAIFRHFCGQLLANWQHLPEIVRTGKPVSHVNQVEDGAEFFAKFVEALFPLSFPAAQKLGEHLGIPAAKAAVSVLDIGAGSGVWGIALAKQSSHVRVRAVDWPRVLEVTRNVARRHGVVDRMDTAPGDLMDADFGHGHQVAIIGHILHSEGIERSRQLLKKTFGALASGGTIAIMEFVCENDRSGPPMSLTFAVNMLIHTDVGDTFSFAEISNWLREAGFVNPRLLEVPAMSPLILATKP